MKNFEKVLFLLFALAAGTAQAECYPSAAGAIAVSQTMPCVTIEGSLNPNGLSVPASATNPLPTILPTPQTYSAVIADLTPAALATDVMVISGSATKTIKINRIQITADATSPSVLDFYVYKRSAADTGGTSSAVSIIAHDSTNATATASVLAYSANPSALGAGTLIRADHYALPAAASTGYPGVPWIEDFGNRNDQQIILHGTSEVVGIGFNGQTIPAGTVVYITIEWTEQ